MTLPLDAHQGVGVQSTCFGCGSLRLRTCTISPERTVKLRSGWYFPLRHAELTDKLGGSLIAMAKTLGEMTVFLKVYVVKLHMDVSN